MAQKPLMLKDYLELDSWSESFWWAPLQRAGGTTVRSLLETELRLRATDKTGWKLFRSRSKGALARVSAAFKLIQFSTDTAGSGSPPRRLSRSFSKKLCRNFSMKRSSLFFHSPVVSRCSSSTEPLSPITENGILVGAGEESRTEKPEKICGKVDMDCPFEEEKEQLSPVSVMDFLYRDEDEDEAEAVVEQPSANSISFEQNIINIERSKNQLLQKIRRFESLANLDPVHLDHHFACTKAHAETAHEEEYENQAQAAHWAPAGGIAAEELGQVAVREVERSGGGWKRFAEEEEIVAVEVTGCVVTWLMEEIVDDLLVSVG